MAYFHAVLARSGGAWVAPDMDLGDAEDPDALADVLRGVEERDGPVLLVVDREDEWFGIVRVDDDEDPRVFVSNASSASRSPYASMLGVDVMDEDYAPEPVGDFDVLADLGTPPAQLRALCDGELGTTEADALTTVAEAAGFADVLDSLR